MQKHNAILLAALLISGCSGGPSNSEVRKAIEANYAECKGLEVEHVKLINGQKIDDQTHQVEVTFDVRVIPLSSSEIEDLHAGYEAYAAENQARDDAKSALQQKMNDLSEQQIALHNRMYQQQNESGNAYLNSEAHAKDEQSDKEFEDAQASLKHQLVDLAIEGQSSTKKDFSLLQAWAGNSWYSCRAKSGIPSDPAGSNDNMNDALTNGLMTSYKLKTVMVKTDNGWMESR